MRREESIRQALSQGQNVILLHSNADLDCTGSAAALALFFGNCRLRAPAGISHLGKKLLANLGIEVDDSDEPATRKVVVDAHSDSSLGYGGIDWDSTIIIDHHRKTREPANDLALIDEDAYSCCELIWRIIDRPEKLERNIAAALLAGILADTGNMKRGSGETALAVAEILGSSGMTLEEMAEYFESAEDQDMSRRISRLKGAQRLKYLRAGDWIVAVSEVGAFEAAVCHAMLGLGADVAFAGSQKDDEYRITGRANRAAVKAGLHLGEMLNRIACEIGGEGGGHDGAAGFSGSGDLEAMLDICSQNAIVVLKSAKQ